MATQHRGRITTWKNDKGFGFIAPDDGGNAVFFHVSSLVHQRTRPSENVTVFYTLIHDGQHRPRAINVRFANEPISQKTITMCVISAFFLVLVLATFIIPISPLVLIIYMFISGITFALYRLDKLSAVQGAWRIPENTLHLFELLGGWPGALVAQVHYRHKNTKASYQSMFWIIVVVNLAILILYSSMRILSNAA